MMNVGSLVGSAILGYLVAKGIKVLLYVIGLFLVVLLILESMGYITVNRDKVVDDVEGLVEKLQDFELEDVKDFAPSIIGFIIGLVLGGGFLSKRYYYGYGV